VELKRLSNELPLAKKKPKDSFLSSVLQNEGRYYYNYVKRRKTIRKYIPVINDHNGKLITDPV